MSDTTLIQRLREPDATTFERMKRSLEAADALEQQAAKENRLAEIICDQAAQIEALRLTNAGLIDSLRDEMDEGLRLRELGGALPDENITAMTERIIGECAAQAAALAEKDAEIARLISTKEHIRKEINAMIGRVEDDAVLIEALRADAERWKSLYRRAINEANDLTNYADDRPELTHAERRLSKIEAEARAAIDAALRQEQPKPLVEIGRRTTPCGECHLQPGECCDICGARDVSAQPAGEGEK